jgi:hypothetical protein
MNILLLIVAAWIGTGLWLVMKSRSRGLAADMLFIATWPIHVAAYLLGKE